MMAVLRFFATASGLICKFDLIDQSPVQKVSGLTTEGKGLRMAHTESFELIVTAPDMPWFSKSCLRCR
jgi:hypothetical protein